MVPTPAAYTNGSYSVDLSYAIKNVGITLTGNEVVRPMLVVYTNSNLTVSNLQYTSARSFGVYYQLTNGQTVNFSTNVTLHSYPNYQGLVYIFAAAIGLDTNTHQLFLEEEYASNFTLLTPAAVYSYTN
jgi:hypothetical protein